MANCIAYEELSVGSAAAIGPTAATVQGGVACAVFYVDPRSAATVRYRPDRTAPTTTLGLPLLPGRSIVVAGEANVRNSLFLTESASATVHCLYYDRVDVVDMGLSATAGADTAAALNSLSTTVREHTRILRQIRNALGEAVFGSWSAMPEDER